MKASFLGAPVTETWKEAERGAQGPQWGGGGIVSAQRSRCHGRAPLAWAAAGVGPPGSCLRTSCKCYRFLPINADPIKRSPETGPERWCVSAFSLSLHNVTLTGRLPHSWEGDAAKNPGTFHLRGLSDVLPRLPLCEQTQPRTQHPGGPWQLIPPPVCFQHLSELCALDPATVSPPCPEEQKSPRSQALTR